MAQQIQKSCKLGFFETEAMYIRELSNSDYNRGFLQLLEQLTTTEADKITYENFCDQMKEMKTNVYVMIKNDRVIGSGSILVEKKFIHRLGSVGHIEDIVIDIEYRRSGLGKQLIEKLKEKAIAEGCYKVILNCNRKNVGFYEKCGFKEKEVEMVIYM